MIRLPKCSDHVRRALVENRIDLFCEHSNRYTFDGLSRLARDAGVSIPALSRVMAGTHRPSYVMVTRVVGALEEALGVKIDPREVIAENGEYPTESVCAVLSCTGQCKGMGREPH